MRNDRVIFFVLTFALGCSEQTQGTDSGSVDTGQNVPDTGSPVDSGNSDTGTAQDSGTDPMDGGTAMDASESDGGDPMDGGDASASGACTNAADEAVHMGSDVSAGVETCAGGCFGAPSCTRDCLIDDVGLSMECAECYVDAVRCSVQNCLGECAGSDSAACEMCRDEMGCTAGFETCSGFTN